MIRVRVGRGVRRRGAIVEGGGERKSANGGKDVRVEGARLELRRHHFGSPESELDSVFACVYEIEEKDLRFFYVRRGVTAGCFVKL